MRMKIWGVVAVMLATFALAEKSIEKQGDAYQYALPLTALACALSNGQALSFLQRYGVQLVMVHGPKNLLGDAAINIRPNGGTRGFPSGHTATATLGASNLAFECLRGHPLVQVGVFAIAGFVGVSRVEAGAHFPWQVLAGFLVGLIADRAFRKTRPIAWLNRLFRRNSGEH